MMKSLQLSFGTLLTILFLYHCGSPADQSSSLSDESAIDAISSLSSNSSSAICDTTQGHRRYCNQIFAESDISVQTLVYSTALNEKTGQPENLLLDLYMPKDDAVTDRPIMFFGHGGGGKRGDGLGWCDHILGVTGYVCADIDYRGGGSVNGADGWEEKLGLTDFQAAVRWARANAKKYGIDPNKVFAMGESLGAIAAVQATITANNLDDSYFNDTYVNKSNKKQPSWTCGAVTISGAVTNQVMPMLDKYDSNAFMFHGEKDHTVDIRQATLTYNNMIRLDIPSTLTLFDIGHKLSENFTPEIAADVIPQLYNQFMNVGCPLAYTGIQKIQ